jgi:uncharacterized protein YraI
MTWTRHIFCVATSLALSAASAAAAPAYVKSTVNLRAGAGTDHESLAKIPAGSLVDAGNCAEGWCEVEWQGKKGFSIATALDMSGRVPVRQGSAPGPRRAYAGPVDEVIPVGPPVYYGPPRYYYPYRPYYYGYYGPRRYWGYRRWRYW